MKEHQAVYLQNKKIYSSTPSPFKNHMLEHEKEMLSIVSQYIIRDIGMYLGQVFTSNHACIKWSYYIKPKTDFFVNQPVLTGFEEKMYKPVFKPSIEPIHMVSIQNKVN